MRGGGGGRNGEAIDEVTVDDDVMNGGTDEQELEARGVTISIFVVDVTLCLAVTTPTGMDPWVMDVFCWTFTSFSFTMLEMLKLELILLVESLWS